MSRFLCHIQFWPGLYGSLELPAFAKADGLTLHVDTDPYELFFSTMELLLFHLVSWLPVYPEMAVSHIFLFQHACI